MADAATQGQGLERPDENTFDPAKAVAIPRDDGGMTIHMDGMPKTLNDAPLTFDADLTPLFTDQQLQRLGGEIVQYVGEDERSRADWRKAYSRGLKLMGLNYEERTEPWEGACGAYHPMLLESVIRFNAQAITDIFPAGGPVKTDIIGRITDEKERQAKRVQTDMNWLLTEKMSGYRDESDMMLFNLAMAGTTFRKFRFDKLRKVPAAEYVLPEHLVMPYSAASLKTADRYTVILPLTNNRIDSLMAEGFYRKIEIGKGIVVQTEITQQKDKIDGRSNSNTIDDALHRLYECHLNYWFEQDTVPGDSLPHPYVVTVDSVSRKILAIRRNWREGDPALERQEDVVQHKYMPGFGPYGIGLINILGGLTESSTSILRQLVDAGVLSNLPAGYKTKSARVKDDSTPIGPGEWRDVEVGMGTLKESFFPLPYGEPSQVLLALLGLIVDEGRRIGSVADMKITDMTGQNMPVGTTLAIIERSMKVMSAVQKRLYESFKNEFKIIAEIVHDFMPNEPYAFELDMRDQKATREADYDDKKVAVIPVADPNASTMAQRIMVLQAVIQLTQTAPNIYDLKAVHRDMITVLGSDKADFYIPPDTEVLPADPITENMNVLTSKPVRAGIAQDHEAHITVHMAAAQDPKIVAMLTNNPAAPGIQAAMQAHVLEHLAFKYRAEIEQQLGVPLPPPDQPLPEDVEYQISRLAASAAGKLLAKDQAEAEQQLALANLKDPVIQNETKALEIKDKDADTKRIKVINEQKGEDMDRQLNVLLTIFKESAATERAAVSAQANKDGALDEKEIRMAELASELGQGVMGQIAKLIIERHKTDAQIAAASARNAS
jgi:hypothetical protein